MDVETIYNEVAEALPEEGFEVTAEQLTHAVLVSLAERLTPDEAAELGAELPEELGDLLAKASGDGRLNRDEFVEDVASRLDIDDTTAEQGVVAVLSSVRRALEPVVAIDQVLEALPPDLAQMMHS